MASFTIKIVSRCFLSRFCPQQRGASIKDDPPLPVAVRTDLSALNTLLASSIVKLPDGSSCHSPFTLTFTFTSALTPFKHQNCPLPTLFLTVGCHGWLDRLLLLNHLPVWRGSFRRTHTNINMKSKH